MRKLLRKLASGVLAAALAVSLVPAAAFAAPAKETHITILGTSDMHANPWGFSYEDDKETSNNGMARLYTYIQQVRAEEKNVVLLDAGDDIHQGRLAALAGAQQDYKFIFLHIDVQVFQHIQRGVFGGKVFAKVFALNNGGYLPCTFHLRHLLSRAFRREAVISPTRPIAIIPTRT